MGYRYIYMSQRIQGHTPSRTRANGNPVNVSGIYNATTPSLSDHDGINLQVDVNGNLKNTAATLHAGEDIVNDVQKVEERFSYVVLNGLSATVVKSGVGMLHSITFNNPGSSWEVDMYDNTSTAATSLGTIRSTVAPTTLVYDVSFSVGLTIDGVKGTTGGDITIAYR